MEGDDANVPRAGDRIDRDAPTCASSESIDVVRKRVKADGREHCVVVNARRVVLGMLGHGEMAGDAGARVADVMQLGPSTFRPNVPISELREYFQKQELSSAPITTPDGVLLGLLHREAV